MRNTKQNKNISISTMSIIQDALKEGEAAQEILVWLHKSYKKPAISRFLLSAQILKTYVKAKKQNIFFSNHFSEISKHIFAVSEILQKQQILKPLFLKNNNFFIISESAEEGYLGDLLCAGLPYGYLSHLSAMRYYNLTNRPNHEMHYTFPTAQKWKLDIENDRLLFFEKIYTDLDLSSRKKDSSFSKFLNNTNFQIPYPENPQISGFEFYTHLSKNYKKPGETPEGLRIPHIGDLFLSMLKEPESCGGKDHVLEVWEEYAAKYYKQILKSAQSLTSVIDRARVGFLLNEIAHISSPLLEDWEKEQKGKRGGSRKFWKDNDYSLPQSPLFSEKWNLSLNDPFFYDYFSNKNTLSS